MKHQLICFDVDGTLDCKENDNEEYLKGIIPENYLVELWKMGYGIAIVSPSPFFPEKWKGENHWFCEYGSNEYRWKNVDDAISSNKTNRFNTLYVDDLEANRKQLENLDVISYSPEKFLAMYHMGCFTKGVSG